MQIWNSPGMHFEPMPFEKSCNMPGCEHAVLSSVRFFYVYGVIARLAALAASRGIIMKIAVLMDP